MVWFPIAGDKLPLNIVSENNDHFLGEEFGKGSTGSFVIQRHQLGEQLKDPLSAWPHHFICVVPQCSLDSLSSLSLCGVSSFRAIPCDLCFLQHGSLRAIRLLTW